ncbi:MAG: hypothetical protein JOZ25_07705 [Actinobacteria bacterium]|nr:hypothetical protein [Actinomycetota bacterium]
MKRVTAPAVAAAAAAALALGGAGASQADGNCYYRDLTTLQNVSCKTAGSVYVDYLNSGSTGEPTHHPKWSCAGSKCWKGQQSSPDAYFKFNSCMYQSNWHMTERHSVSCKFAKKAFADYYNNGPNSDGTLVHHKRWHCPSNYNPAQGKCWTGKKSNPDASFRYKAGYGV